MDAAGETPAGLRAALADQDKRKGWPTPEEWVEHRNQLADELAILEGRTFPHAVTFDQR